jgi:hypothetical protein
MIIHIHRRHNLPQQWHNTINSKGVAFKTTPFLFSKGFAITTLQYIYIKRYVWVLFFIMAIDEIAIVWHMMLNYNIGQYVLGILPVNIASAKRIYNIPLLYAEKSP